jgi:hypothetical protein
MNMRRIAQDEGSALPETVGHPVMHVVDREPVHLLDLELEILRCAVADVFEGQIVDELAMARLDGSNQADAPFVRQGEDGQEVGIVEVAVEVAVDRGPFAGHVSHVKDLRIGPTGKARAHDLADFRLRAVAAGDKSRGHCAFGAVRAA